MTYICIFVPRAHARAHTHKIIFCVQSAGGTRVPWRGGRQRGASDGGERGKGAFCLVNSSHSRSSTDRPYTWQAKPFAHTSTAPPTGKARPDPSKHATRESLDRSKRVSSFWRFARRRSLECVSALGSERVQGANSSGTTERQATKTRSERGGGCGAPGSSAQPRGRTACSTYGGILFSESRHDVADAMLFIAYL
jgi:hypothetical protein